ncbi:PadR family transcriptional regulator [Paenibacillus glycanilyticus]|uniref:PadR family transcriptional regulator n=1 Tax=Paenibacillus glycanilyticus TaxID=126569 RepID=UPI0020423039|nr:PadR family transcriptional regulator [Paenibacillus glycanilyticus]MCM3631625.1 PadR family transcriptional regulator [Paenibacillus glycanilyticus]
MNSQDVILGLLHRQPRSGYEIKQMLEMPLSFFFDASFGTIYPTLAKLETQGFIVKESVIQEGRPNKNVYSLTDAGRAQFQAYLESPIEKDVFRSDFLVRIFFGEYLDGDTLIDWVRDEIRKSEEDGEKIRQMQEQLPPGLPPAKTLCLDIGAELNAAKTRTLQETLRKLTEQS